MAPHFPEPRFHIRRVGHQVGLRRRLPDDLGVDDLGEDGPARRLLHRGQVFAPAHHMGADRDQRADRREPEIHQQVAEQGDEQQTGQQTGHPPGHRESGQGELRRARGQRLPHGLPARRAAPEGAVAGHVLLALGLPPLPSGPRPVFGELFLPVSGPSGQARQRMGLAGLFHASALFMLLSLHKPCQVEVRGFPPERT